MLLRFWGVRGSIPCPDPAMARYGGNTACVEVSCGDDTIIFDGGTGLRPLGSALLKTGQPVRANILYSHCHVDHVCGLPFFAPVDLPTTNLRLWAGNPAPDRNLKQTLGRLFGDTVGKFACAIDFQDFLPGETLVLRPDIIVHTGPLNHPGGATGYRLEYDGRAIAYVTDTEHRPNALDENVVRLARNADLLIYDCTYTQDEFSAHVGWGHSTWQEGVRLAEAANVMRLAIFHHDPAHDDDFLDRVGLEAAAARAGTFVAREGATIRF